MKPQPSTARPPEFDREVRAEMLSGVRILSALGGTLFLCFIGLDYTEMPQVFDQLLPIRLGVGAVSAAFFIATRAFSRELDLVRHARAVTALFTVFIFAALAACVPIVWPFKATGVIVEFSVAAPCCHCALSAPAHRYGAVAGGPVGRQPGVCRALSGGTNPEAVVDFSAIFVCVIAIGVFTARRNDRLRFEAFTNRRRTEQLLLNILPEDVAVELRQNGRVEPRHVESCTILFSDFVGFTALSARVRPAELVASLDRAFQRFDQVTDGHGLEKLKTIGDAYMCAGGVMQPREDHLQGCLEAGLDMLDVLGELELRDPEGRPWQMRLGLHSGPVVAGVIGIHKFAFDLWGDTVNVAARAEAAGRPGGVCMTARLFEPLAGKYVAEDLGAIELKGKGTVELVLVTGRRVH